MDIKVLTITDVSPSKYTFTRRNICDGLAVYSFTTPTILPFSLKDLSMFFFSPEQKECVYTFEKEMGRYLVENVGTSLLGWPVYPTDKEVGQEPEEKNSSYFLHLGCQKDTVLISAIFS